MKFCKLILLVTICATLFSSCFKDEPLMAECDITQAYITIDDPEEMFFNVSDTMVNVLYTNSEITFNIRKKADLSALAPKFVITKGATIVPANGSVQDFSNGPVIYTVTSEDRKWHRTYRVSFIPITRTISDTLKFDFERYRLDESGKYYTWFDFKEDGTEANIWSTGNPGFKISMSSATPDMYPTVPEPDGYDGAAVKLTTRSTGPFGVMANKRLAAGNLFVGEFDVNKALDNSMLATRFGVTLEKKPLKFTGYYKYTAGEDFQNAAGKIERDKKDFGTIYSVVYRNHDADGNPIVLYGDNVQTSPQVVAIAKLDNLINTEEWTPFEINFNYYEEIDEQLLENYGYNFTIVCSSSERGAYFEGAIGSTLMVDKFRIICSKTEE